LYLSLSRVASFFHASRKRARDQSGKVRILASGIGRRNSLDEARAEWRRRNPRNARDKQVVQQARERLREQIAKCSRRAAQKIVAKFKTGKP